MRQTYSLISKVLHSPYTVLLRGETGTGKEVVARAIHDCGPRRSQAFIVQNCAAFPENLLESELFGYRKGAFTGADRDRAGLFDAANGGTLLLDEIGDMPLSLQAKILRVLQEGEIRPLGSNDTHKIDVRIIAATHRDLSTLVSEGKFREDLYYRLAQFPIELPALRQREGDILELAQHFAEKTCTYLQRDPVRWSSAALEHLSGYTFPGNVRELKALVERAVLLCEGGELLAEHFSLRMEPMPEDNSQLESARTSGAGRTHFIARLPAQKRRQPDPRRPRTGPATAHAAVPPRPSEHQSGRFRWVGKTSSIFPQKPISAPPARVGALCFVYTWRPSDVCSSLASCPADPRRSMRPWRL